VIHFAMVNIFYSCKYVASKAGSLYPDTLTYPTLFVPETISIAVLLQN